MFRDIFYDENNNLRQEGSLMVLPELAETLRRIAEAGSDEFYKGELSKDILADLTEKSKFGEPILIR